MYFCAILFAEVNMSNIRHVSCAVRTMASDAKKRLLQNRYPRIPEALIPPKGLTPSQRQIYFKLLDLSSDGEEVVNPIKQLADENKMKELSHEERQRYILELSADYVSMKKLVDENLIKSNSFVSRV